MKKTTRLREFINKEYNGRATALAKAVNEWHGSEVFKIYEKGWTMLSLWAKGEKKPRQLRWAWLLLCKFVRVKFGVRMDDRWLEIYENPEDVDELTAQTVDLFTETEETLPGFEPDAVRAEMLGKIEDAAHKFVPEVFIILKNTPSPWN